MRILPYYIIHTFINAIKKLFKTWVAVFFVIIVGMGIVGGIIGGLVGSVIEDNTEPSSSYSQDDENITTEDDTITNDAEDNTDEMDLEESYQIIEIIIGLVALVVVLFNIYCGDKSGAKIFTMPDVNFLFSSPMKPQSILMFKTVLQMGVGILSSIYLLFQIPNLVFNVGLGLGACVAMFLAWIIILFIGKLTAVCTYTIAATHQNLRKYIRPFVISVVLILAVAVGYLVYIKKYNILDAQVLLFASKPGRFIPIFGWLRGMVLSFFTGEYLNAGLYLLLLTVACILLAIVIWKIKADFYEDALKNANEVQEAVNNAKSGGTVQRKKDRSEKIKRNGELNGEGANVFLTKTIYNRKRFAKLGFLTATSETYSLLAITCCVLCKFFIKTDTYLPIVFVLLIAVFFRNMGNPIAEETSHNFIFMIPESPFKKLLYSLLSGSYETALDLLPPFIISAIVLRGDLASFFVWYLLWVSFDIFCSAVGVTIELIIPTGIVPAIKGMLGMMIRMLAIIPGLLLIIFGLSTSFNVLALCLVVIINLAITAILFAISPRFLHSGKN